MIDSQGYIGEHWRHVKLNSQVHDWVVYKLGTLLGSVGHKVKIHNITPVTCEERVDIKTKDYVVL